MKIGSQHLDPPAQTAQGVSSSAPKPSQGAAEQARSTGASAGVSVSVSTLARSMEKPEPALASDVDVDKVNSIKNAIKNGTYVVNPHAIADKLLSNAQDFLNAPSH